MIINIKAIAIYTILFFATTAYALAGTSATNSIKSLSTGGKNLRNLVVEAAERDERETLDLKGIMFTEHINLVVGSKDLAAYFYLEFLGFTKDAGTSFHVNLGQQQFHLAEGNAQRIAGSIGLVVPTLDTVRLRIPAALEQLKSTQFSLESDDENCITLTCPWGNTIHLYGVDNDRVESSVDSSLKMVNLHVGAYGAHRMAIRGSPGIRYIEIACPMNKSPAVANFYREMLGCTVVENDGVAMVCVGPGVHLVFVESGKLSGEDTSAMKGVHVCFYATDFMGLYERLAERDIIWTNPRFLHLDSCDTWADAAASRTLRFKDVIDLKTGEKILELEHETRPLRHGQYLKVPRYEPK
jgi:catechol-2,3-dioxygenase